MPTNQAYVIMGVAGAGKTVVGRAFAEAIGAEFVDGDDYHTAANVSKMAAGTPLTDSDRAGWLSALADRIRSASRDGDDIVVACSALKRSYRDVLRTGNPNLQFIFLHGSRKLIAERLAERRGHYMPGALLDSQLATLEPPSPDEHAWSCDVRDSPAEIVTALTKRANQ